MAGICTSPYPSPYPTEKVGDSPYPYPYPVNAGIPRQNGDGFGQYPRGRVYLPSLGMSERGSSFHAQLGNAMSEGVHSRKDRYACSGPNEEFG